MGKLASAATVAVITSGMYIGQVPRPEADYGAGRSTWRQSGKSLRVAEDDETETDIRSAQKLAWENKLAKGFGATDVPLEFCLLGREIAGAFDAWRKSRRVVVEELAETAIFLLGLTEMIGVDLQRRSRPSSPRTRRRVCRRLSNVVPAKNAAAALPDGA